MATPSIQRYSAGLLTCIARHELWDSNIQYHADQGTSIVVTADLGGSSRSAYVEETEILAFDCLWDGAHYHSGPRNKNHRIYWVRTVVDDPLGWVFEQIEEGRLCATIERAGYPGVAAGLDMEKVSAVLPDIKQKAREFLAEGMALTGRPALPLEPTPNPAPS